jgi:hypothetical protein
VVTRRKRNSGRLSPKHARTHCMRNTTIAHLNEKEKQNHGERVLGRRKKMSDYLLQSTATPVFCFYCCWLFCVFALFRLVVSRESRRAELKVRSDHTSRLGRWCFPSWILISGDKISLVSAA